MAKIKKAQSGKQITPDYSNIKGKGWDSFKTPTAKDSADYREGFKSRTQKKDLKQYPSPSSAKVRGYNEADSKLKKQKNGGSTPAWQRKEGKSPSGGLNAKGRASLKAAGHNIKPPQPGGGPRKKSFCARMSGMKKKLTSSKTANDPNSRINKSLRKWKC